MAGPPCGAYHLGMSRLFLVFCALSLAGAINVWRPLRRPSALAGLSFFAGWLTGELPLHHVGFGMAVTLGFASAGALGDRIGLLGLALALLAWALLLVSFRRSHEAREAMERALRDGLGEDYADELPPSLRGEGDAALVNWRSVLFPFPIRRPEVERLADIEYHAEGRLRLRLDVYRRRAPGTGRPALLYVHGGGWVLGNKGQQGLPFMQLLAAQGWVCFAIDYRLSPRATFPDHLVDVKRAIAFARAHAAEYGADPDFLLLAGNSAGAHLASLAALTPNRPEYQPGFEQRDTSVAGCIPFYGVYDFADRFGHWPHDGMQRLVERAVMKARRHEHPEAFERASPIALVHAGAPPFFLVHGTLDTLVPLAEAHRFEAALRAVSSAPVGLAVVAGAQHAFEVFPSVRALYAVAGAARFANVLWHRERRLRVLGSAPDDGGADELALEG